MKLKTTGLPSVALAGLIVATVGALSLSVMVPIPVSVVDPTIPVDVVTPTVKVSVDSA
ncbi:hypothetical protein [Flavobacterium psychrophilum]|uniref:hypothetical protein n=1 Tax=Flavobacterium psychrophilum TaxID=96345 RepID=UPI00141BB39E|nr:hypothetical protein [Flavobacterium psychrophilum]